MFQIEYVEIDNNKPFEEFLNTLKIEEIAKTINTIDYFLELKNNNLPLKESLSKYLQDGIFEIKINLPNKIARVLYYYIVGKKIIITHGFIKKTQKISRKEIEKAQELRNKYNRRMHYD